jgi:hypothetical protein
MRNASFLIVALLSFSSPSVLAAEKDYKLCSVGGFFSGANDKFQSGLAAHIAKKKHLIGDPICSALWENAYRIGEKLSKTGRVKEEAEEEIVHQAQAFSERIYEAISKKLEF